MPGPELRLKIIAEDLASRVLDDVSKKLIIFDAQGKVAWKGLALSTQEYERGMNNAAKATNTLAAQQSAMRDTMARVAQTMAGAFSTYAIIGFIKSAVAGAEEEAQAMRRLQIQVDAAGQAHLFNANKVQAWASAMQDVTRFTDDQYVSAMARAVQRTQDLTSAQNLTTLAADIASATQRDLASAMEMLSLAASGNQRGLMMLRREFPALLGHVKSVQGAFDVLGQKYSGTAEREESLTKTTAILRSHLSDLKENLGREFTPEVENAAKGVDQLVQAFNRLWTGKQKQNLREQIEAIQQQIDLEASRVPQSIAGSATLVQVEKDANDKIADLRKQLAELDKQLKTEEKARAKETSQIKVQETDAEGRAAKKTLEERKKAEREINDLLKDLAAERAELAEMEYDVKLIALEKEKEARMRAIEDQFEAGNLSFEQMSGAMNQVEGNFKLSMSKLNQDYDVTAAALKATTDAVSGAIASGFGSAFADIILEGKTLGDSMKAVFDSILHTAIETFTQVAIQKALISGATAGATGGVGFLGGIFGFQHGTLRVPGPMGAPRMALVHGGEQVVPPGGNYTPSGAGGSGGGGGSMSVQLIFPNAAFSRQDGINIAQVLTALLRQNVDVASELAAEVGLSMTKNAGKAY